MKVNLTKEYLIDGELSVTMNQHGMLFYSKKNYTSGSDLVGAFKYDAKKNAFTGNVFKRRWLEKPRFIGKDTDEYQTYTPYFEVKGNSREKLDAFVMQQLLLEEL